MFYSAFREGGHTLCLVHTGDKIDFDTVDFVEVDGMDRAVDRIDNLVDFDPAVDFVDSTGDKKSNSIFCVSFEMAYCFKLLLYFSCLHPTQ